MTASIASKNSHGDEVDIDGRRISLVAPEDLILSKLEWAKEGRSQLQLDDVRNLLRAVQILTGLSGPTADRLGPVLSILRPGWAMRDTAEIPGRVAEL